MKSYLLILLAATASLLLTAQSPFPDVMHTEATYLGESPELRSMVPLQEYYEAPAQRKKTKTERKNFGGLVPMPTVNHDALPKGVDPLRQAPRRDDNVLMPLVNVDNLPFNNIFPPDPNGSVGQNYVISTANDLGGTQIIVKDKAGRTVLGPIISTPLFWEGIGQQGIGDPIIFYDQEAKRWVITEFSQFGSNLMLMAVSTTESPLGSWYLYSVPAPSFPDYPKFGKWNDSYFITTNEGGDPNIPVYLVDRQALLGGAASAPVVRTGLPKFTTSASDEAFQVASPIDWIGDMAPPAGDPLRVVRIRDDAWGSGFDALEIWEYDLDWSDVSSLTVNGPVEIPLAPFDASLCNGSLFDCIINPNGQTQSVLAQIVMHRPVYRRFSDHESIVLNFSVDVDPAVNLSGIRWVELRREDADWFLYQEGTYSPDDDHRFMGSISMDRHGNILLGFSVLGRVTEPGLRFTGRRADDPLGEMTISEGSIIEGANSNNTVRWGDYSSMTVDPVDQETFWYVGEYMTQSNWSTRAAAFRFAEDSVDIRPVVVQSPDPFSDFSQPVPITVAIQNLTDEPISNYRVTVEADGIGTFDTTIAAELAAWETRSISFNDRITITDRSVDLLVYTSKIEDERRDNDTLRANVEGVNVNDVSPTVPTGLNDVLCSGDEKQLDVLLSNTGFGGISSVQIVAVLNEVDTQRFQYNGFIPPLSSEIESINLSVPDIGSYDVLIYTTLPNDRPDDNPLADTIRGRFQKIVPEQSLTLNILTDDYPTETSWIIQDLGTLEIIAEGNGGIERLALLSSTICVEDGCYNFTIFDSAGDGLCCGFGEGEFLLIDGEGNILAQGAEFGSSLSFNFCLPFECMLSADVTVTDATADGNRGAIIINQINGVGPFDYSIDGGTTFTDDPLFFDLEGNQTYSVVVRDINGCVYEEDVFVDFITSTSETALSRKFTASPNPTRGELSLVLQDWADAANLSVEILNQNGLVVRSTFLYRYGDRMIGRVSLLDKAPGVYYVALEIDGQRVMKKIIYTVD